MNDLNARLAASEKDNSKLREQVEELSDFFENASLPLHRVNSSGTIIWANQAELDLLGYTRGEYIGKSITDFHSDKSTISNILSRLTKNETLQNFPASLRAKNGDIKHVLINSNVLMKDGEFIHTRCFTRDITEIKNEVEKKNDFIAMVSHELKTPLTAIKSYVQILLSKASREKDEYRINMLGRTDAHIKKMVRMMEDFLNLSRLEDGKIELNKEVFNFGSLAAEVIEEMQILVSTHKFHFSECDVNVFADREKMSHILTNLLSNAVKFSPAGGKITLACEEEHKTLTVSVSDEGIGIDKKAQVELFKKFYRVENETTRHISGFGMGLYLVAEILKAHNSAIQVKSEEGVGSTFYFSLPIRRSSKPRPNTVVTF